MAIAYVNTPKYTTSETIVINGDSITMTGTSMQDATDDINTASVANVTASISNTDIITLTSNLTAITLAEGTGTALVDLGFVAGVSSLSIADLAQAVIDIDNESIPGLTALDVGSYLELTSVTNDLVLAGTGVTPFGFTADTYDRIATVSNAVTDITAEAIPNVTVSDIGGRLNMTSTGSSSVDLVLAEGSGTALADLGFIAGTFMRTSTASDALVDLNAAAIPNMNFSETGSNELVMSSTVVDIVLLEGSGTSLVDLGFTAGTFPRTSDHDDAITDITAQTGAELTAIDDGDTKIKIIMEGEALGSELVTNGSFDSDLTGWAEGSTDTGSGNVISWNAGGYLDMTKVTDTNRAYTDFPTVIGTKYRIVIEHVGGVWGYHLATFFTGSDLIDSSNGSVSTTAVFYAESTTTYLKVFNTTVGTSSVDNVSVKEDNANPVLTLAEGTGTTLADLGFVAITRRALPLGSSIDDVNDIVSFFTELIPHDKDNEPGDDLLPALEQDLRRNDDVLLANSANSSGEGFSIEVIDTSTRTTAWSAALFHEFSLTFTDDDEARAYFNTGSDIRFSANRSGGSATTQNTAWDALLTSVPPPFVSSDYFALTTSYVEFYAIEDISGGPYDTPNPIKWTISAKTDAIGGPNGGNGNIVTIQMQYLDQHTGATDEVDGTFVSTVSGSHSTDIFVKPLPVYDVIVEITAGV